VAQQGMNGERKQPRRYHWLSEGLKSFVEEPHTAIDGLDQGVIVNLTDARAESSRRDQAGMLRSLGPDKIAHELSRLQTSTDRRVKAVDPEQPTLPHLVMPAHHDVSPGDVLTRRACTVIQPPPRNADPPILPNCYWFPELGREPCALLAMVAEVLHGAPYRFSDPARFSFALGGKDRHPFPVRVHVYDQTIRVLKSAAKLGRDEELGTLKRLDEQSRRLERFATGTTVDALVSLERRESHLLGGRSVFGWEQAQSDRTGAN